MNVAIVGSSGYISSYLIKSLNNSPNVNKILKIDQNEECCLKLEVADSFDYSVLDEIDYVVFTAAISGPDDCAKNYEQCWQINVEGTSYFIEQALDKNCKVLFFSSDAVFGKDESVVYTENSPTKASMAYGVMKKTVEDKFMNNKLFKAIRLSYVVSSQDRFISYCIKSIVENRNADIFHPFYRNCITVSDVTSVVLWMINNWDEYKPIFLNVAGTELVSRVRMADELNRKFGNRLNYTISKPDGDFYKNRPAITQMKSLYLDEYKIIETDNFTEKFIKELENIVL